MILRSLQRNHRLSLYVFNFLCGCHVKHLYSHMYSTKLFFCIYFYFISIYYINFHGLVYCTVNVLCILTKVVFIFFVYWSQLFLFSHSKSRFPIYNCHTIFLSLPSTDYYYCLQFLLSSLSDRYSLLGRCHLINRLMRGSDLGFGSAEGFLFCFNIRSSHA